MEMEKISVVLPSIRKENLIKYLKNIRNMNYPQESIEIIVAWGLDTDMSDVERQFDCKFVYDNTSDMEKRRRTSIESASGKWIFMADDDNYFKNTDLFRNMLAAIKTEGASAAECVWQEYEKSDPLINRYCALIGAYDPAVFYLKSQDHMQAYEKNWSLKGKLIKETDSYFVVEFKPEEIPTMGDQGFLIKKEDMRLGNNGEVFMHMDVCSELAKINRGRFVFMKDCFGHDCVKTEKELLQKLKRNVDRFQVDGNQRSMNYNLSVGKMIKLGLILGTFIIPMKDAIKGFIHIKDIAWFEHPLLCFKIACIYTSSTIKARLKRS